MFKRMTFVPCNLPDVNSVIRFLMDGGVLYTPSGGNTGVFLRVEYDSNHNTNPFRVASQTYLGSFNPAKFYVEEEQMVAWWLNVDWGDEGVLCWTNKEHTHATIIVGYSSEEEPIKRRDSIIHNGKVIKFKPIGGGWTYYAEPVTESDGEALLMSGYRIELHPVPHIVDRDGNELEQQDIVHALNRAQETEIQLHRLLVHAAGAVDHMEKQQMAQAWVLNRVVGQVKEFLENEE